MLTTPQQIEARLRAIRARIEGQMWPQLWLFDLMEIAGLEHKLAAIYEAQRRK